MKDRLSTIKSRRSIIRFGILTLLLVPGIVTATPPTVISIWGGARHCIALKSDGTVWDWGFNWYGKLGDGTFSTFSPPDYTNDRHTPIQVHGPGNVGFLSSITAIMGCEAHNFALKSDGTVWAWGNNSFFGQ